MTTDESRTASPAGPDSIALLYDDGAYVETLKAPAGQSANAPLGLMGRQVAGKAFLEALLAHGRASQYLAITLNAPSAHSFANLCQTHPAPAVRTRKYHVADGQHFHRTFFPNPPSRVIHIPQPPEPRFAWARSTAAGLNPEARDAYAISGVTHTLSSTGAVETLNQLVLAPFEPYDALICTSRAVANMVRAVTGSYCDHLRDRFGGDPGLKLRVETIPLGVDTEKYRPATPAERASVRQALKIGDDEVVVLFVGRLSFHAKAHPFPMYESLARAARATARKVRLICSGWAANEGILRAWVDGSRAFAPEVRTDFLDGTSPAARYAVWHAADIFTSLSDNIQETFGLVVIESMACGVPAVVTDWDGYRDLIVQGNTGYLVPTLMVRGATLDTTSRHLFGEINYDLYLAACSQAAVVDIGATAEAFTKLIGDENLRRTMGEAGRAHALNHFAWPRVIRAYESLWGEMDAERQARVASPPKTRRTHGPACYPPPEVAFAGYPTAWIEDTDRLEATHAAVDRLPLVLNHPLCNYHPDSRSTDATLIRNVLAAASKACEMPKLDAVFAKAGIPATIGRATIAWMLKYGLLVRVPAVSVADRS
ncbi:MAG TPA: glycosyltransferase family 4 protein [Gemmataceae bacterium]|jgi:glycosyltransferase involved in cell wall biosynthesis|nr:glycosyltransferase family 4 protein [Gemmataceae bacterium]